MNKKEYQQLVHDIMDYMQVLIMQKNADYSDGDDPFANFRISQNVGVDPLTGLWIRMEDKFQRIRAYLNRGDLKVENESIRDAFLDTIGYSLLALGMIQEKEVNAKEKVQQETISTNGSQG